MASPVSALEWLATRWIARRAARDPEAVRAARDSQSYAVVTGGSEGIGFAIARRIVRRGQPVLLVARRGHVLESAARHLREETNDAAAIHTLALDVTAPDAPAIILRRVAELGGHVDLLVNNAGLGHAGRFESAAPDAIDALIALNMAAPTRLMRAMLPHMRARGAGGILNIASLGGYAPGPHQAAYYASKAYVISLSEAVASEVAGEGVRICVVAPGPVETQFHARMGAEGSPYRILLPAMTPDRIAASALLGYRLGRRVVVPGLLNTLMAASLKVLPHPLSVPLVGWLLRPPAAPRRPPDPDAR